MVHDETMSRPPPPETVLPGKAFVGVDSALSGYKSHMLDPGGTLRGFLRSWPLPITLSALDGLANQTAVKSLETHQLIFVMCKLWCWDSTP